MRVLQLIDTLRPGGAERMAVSYANALAKRVEGSFLCCTRQEGLLKKELVPEVGYLFIVKKSTLDLAAFLKLRNFVRANRIDVIQAHSSSWFLGLMVKKSLQNVRLIWHDHFGRELKFRKTGLLKPASKYFDGTISVNEGLRQWSVANLNASKVKFFPNFVPTPKKTSSLEKFISLQGKPNSFKILCLANLRPQKDHLNLLRGFKMVVQKNESVSLHLVGKDENDEYSAQLKEFVRDEDLVNEKVFFYGEQENVLSIMKDFDLGILSSASEGLPVALLEYGLAGLPVIATEVGECSGVIGDSGRICPPNAPAALAQEIIYYLENSEKRIEDAANFQKHIIKSYSEEAVLKEVLVFLEDVNL